ncbi:Na(+)-translocating NADH-quinone reductase subunit A [Prevotella sp. KH2C16]|uniref:Na(+)-translocating NADH-quinone reductase subunit A n=1 Tax=Prevotella sp. KH2C16 TaxID=1855325 RepID=UPI0008E6D3A7|nr:Na(+)-translocating NADH-quinone reductase subunit A [Prevotella sp. KH2C16]SFG10661.1 Na+-transporting NADH:ubiquinone oxidoreductase subunit A [Prevotella sp. KH2C16]
MANVIKLRKGLDIKLKGKAVNAKINLEKSEEYALVPDDFIGISPKITVKEGDHIKVGEALFVNKFYPCVKFASPVSGTITAIVRGERRKIVCVKVKADAQQEYVNFEKKNPSLLDAQEVKDSLLKAGLFGYINQIPYAISTNPETKPKAIFVSALRDMPLAGDFEIELEGNEAEFQAGLTALSRVSKTYLGIGAKAKAKALTAATDVQITIFDGPCPAGNVGIQVNHLNPVNKGEVVWVVDPTAVIFFGRLFLEGKVDLTRTIAIAGSGVTSPQYVNTLVGTPLKSILEGNLVRTDHIRIINGNPLTGRKANTEDYLGAHTSEVCVIPEGDNADEILGWILPRTKQFSISRSYFSWLQKGKEYDLDARIKGGERHMIMSGEYDKVLPMDIYAEYLIKAIIAGDIDKQEELGIYEISPEDFAVAEFVDSSKLPLQEIVRKGLDTLRKENA